MSQLSTFFNHLDVFHNAIVLVLGQGGPKSNRYGKF